MLKVKFWRIENVVAMKVLEQPSGTRGKNVIFENDDFQLVSELNPEIAEGVCYLRGTNRAEDHFVVSGTFDSIDRAKTYIKRATETICKYNESIGELVNMDKDDIEVSIAM